ncbi:TPA: ABC transporter ATP-binding protein [Streptococcus equi subsp. zooepidemicus]|uniref:ABC transporter ATP-binding protein n=1 Tax=Streptococcus equi TaxID=1336 RepID=UPI001E3088EF|nr:ABC transporter ATP-binding protein [Streptococcus equi]MCD3461952.1 ABC transporter ATP-binding protein [Streptococcus equi subsp. zooepidemicus]HEK9980225.1 ABC transporter ATP-binding protein [Streptococcus equi subsp. zooepidemicus]HEL0765437.1 ABC transporter ATP-binding protein [Streptococcus equi subsp. zooepidemicus]HEL0788267.1 ABC transporter ATP-binding protein [Streptococcus equi subsp. zooepidemicus]HEL1129797.1 ABC transporter ATP-binding protein [Streptococcus equi subsp. zoo
MELVIEVSHLYKAFDGQDRLTDVNFKIKKGECVALIGPNGAGKTTLFNCLLGACHTKQQAVRILGKSPRSFEVNQVRAILFQENQVQAKMTVLDLIHFEQQIAQSPLPMSRIKELLELTSDQLHQMASSLSGGQKRLLSFILTLVGQPEVLLLDEPTNGMDTSTRQRFWTIIDQLKKEGKTILYSSHYIEEVEHTADRILVLHKGRLICDTTPYAMSAEKCEKVMTVPIDYKSILMNCEDIASLVEKKDHVTFVTQNPRAVWQHLQRANCPIEVIEMTNRTLLDRIFMTMKG